MTTLTIEQLKAQLQADTQAAMDKIRERKERLSLERMLSEVNNESLQEIKAERDLLNDSALTIDKMVETVTKAVKSAQLQTRTGSELSLNFYPTNRKGLVADKFTALMNSMVYTRPDVAKLVASELGLTEVDIEAYSSALGRNDSFTPELGIIKGHKGNAKMYNNNLNMLAEKLGIYLPTVTYTQEEFDKAYDRSVKKAELEQRDAQEAEEQWNLDNSHGLSIDLS